MLEVWVELRLTITCQLKRDGAYIIGIKWLMMYTAEFATRYSKKCIPFRRTESDINQRASKCG
jgi:hypothetical protein